jgi:uncharacterized protein (TIGR02266 family)
MTGPSKRSARTVLVADDTAFVRDRFRSALEGAGHTAVTVRNRDELLDQVRALASAIDLIVLDLRLPHGNGVALLKAIHKLNQHPPVVIFSGTIASADEVRELDTLGVVGYINEYTSVQHILPSLVPHLFPERSDRRSSPRVVLGIPVSYRFGNTIAAALTFNISHGGVGVRTTSPLDVNTPLRVRFRLPSSRNEIEVEAKVAWTDRRLGMGVRFTKVSAADQDLIDDYVKAHFFSNRRA